MPDRSIPIQGLLQLYPFSAQDVVNAMQQNGLHPHDCTGTLTVNPQTMNIYQSDETYEPGLLTISNMTTSEVTVDAFTADPLFALQCMYEGQDVTEGMTVAAGQSATVEVYVDVPVKQTFEGKMYISTSSGDFEVNIIYETTVGVSESNSDLILYPNPVKDILTLRGTDLQNIMVFNDLGQKIDEWMGDDIEVRISTARYENGIHFVKVNGEKTMRFVVNHK